MKTKAYKLLPFVAILNQLDLLITKIGLNMGFTEKNPLYYILGDFNFFIFKNIVTCFLIVLYIYLDKKERKDNLIVYNLLLGVIGLQCIVFFFNTVNIIFKILLPNF